MKAVIKGQPIFDIPITPLQLGILKQLSESHYDAYCRSISVQGGFLYGWENHQRFLSESAAYESQYRETATWRQLDTLQKCLEGRPQLRAADERAIADKLSRMFWTLMNEATHRISSWEYEVELEDGQ